MTEGLFVMVLFGIPMVMLLVLVITVTRNEGRRDRLRYEERRLMIERGMTPPDDAVKRSRPPSDFLLPGLLLLFLGLGLLVAPPLLFDVAPGSFGRAVMAGGIVLGLLGVGNLVYYRLGGGPRAHAPGEAGRPARQGEPQGPPLNLGDRT